LAHGHYLLWVALVPHPKRGWYIVSPLRASLSFLFGTVFMMGVLGSFIFYFNYNGSLGLKKSGKIMDDKKMAHMLSFVRLTL
jgi:hypothetical protein